MFTEWTNYWGLLNKVSLFGHLRIKDYLASPRSLSQPRYVLHRLLESRHPPYALTFLLGTVKTTKFIFFCLRKKMKTIYNFWHGRFRKTASAISTFPTHCICGGKCFSACDCPSTSPVTKRLKLFYPRGEHSVIRDQSLGQLSNKKSAFGRTAKRNVMLSPSFECSVVSIHQWGESTRTEKGCQVFGKLR